MTKDTITFDTLKIIHQLEMHGFTSLQAETIVAVLEKFKKESSATHLATQTDFDVLFKQMERRLVVKLAAWSIILIFFVDILIKLCK